MYFDEFKHQLPDIDEGETQEWLDSFDQLVEQEGESRARFIVYKLLKRARQLLVEQLCALTGGPCVYIGRDMKTAHGGLGITEQDWAASMKHLAEAIDKQKVRQNEKEELLTIVAAYEKDIVEKSDP